MTKSLVFRSSEQPTFFNREALLGTFLAPVIGTVIGAFVGKNRMEREATGGKVAGTPSLLSVETWNGFFLGGLAGNIISAIVLVAAGATLVAGSVAIPPAIGVGALATIILAPIGGIIAGTIFGARSGKSRMENEYAVAVEQSKEEGRSVNGPQCEPELEQERTHFRDRERQRATSPLSAARGAC